MPTQLASVSLGREKLTRKPTKELVAKARDRFGITKNDYEYQYKATTQHPQLWHFVNHY